MRVLHMVTRSHLRGAELAALDLADELTALGHDNRVVALSPGFDGTTEPRLPALSQCDPRAPTAVARHWRAMRRLTYEYKPDVVLAHGGTAARVAALARSRGRPLVVWQRILQFPAGTLASLRSPMWRIVARRVDAAIALTPRNDTELRALGFRGPVWHIPNSRRAAPFAVLDRVDAVAKLRAELGVEPDVPLVGLVGHLIEQKRPERAVAVLEAIRRSGIPAHLVVVGDGPLRASVTEVVERRRLRPHVSLLGVRRDVPQLLAGLDVLLVTSDAEGIPGVIIEAGMAACPVVTFPFDGASEIANPGTVVLDRTDVLAMAEATAAILADPDRRAAMGQAARESAMQLSTEQIAHEYAGYLVGLLEERRRPTQPAVVTSTSAT